MSKSLLQTRIIDKLEVILTQVDTMNKFGKNIPLIHLDILKSNVRTLYELIGELERSQMQTSTVHQTVRPMAKEVIVEKREEEIVEQARQTISQIVDSIQDDIANEYPTEIPIEFTNEEISFKAAPKKDGNTPINSAPEENTPAPEKTSSEPMLFEETVMETISEDTVSEFHSEVEVTETMEVRTETEISVETETMIIDIKETTEEVIEETVNNPIPDIFSSLQTIADRYKSPDSTLNETLSMSGVTTINSSVKQIRDLKSAIGINEKFLFINDLFKGNMKEYTDTILALNETDNIEKAKAVLQPLKEKYQWHEDTLAYTTLMDFLQRRFV